MTAEKYFTEEIRSGINAAIAAAEKKTSGEIRLFIENNCAGEVLDRAAFLFKEMKMDATKERNGVLFYLAMKTQKFAILGDSGINAKVPKDFWLDIKVEMQNYFVKEEFAPGLVKGITMAGDALQKYFPYLKDDKNELSDEILFGKQ
jgi:uncharacterized membrane protein